MTTDPHLTLAPTRDAAKSIVFADLALPEALLSVLAEDGYSEPSPIQAAIIPPLLAGRDVIGQAQTGTGKTAAFALPILAQLVADAQSDTPKPKGPTALILAPTRELAIQVADAFARYARKLPRISAIAIYGGAEFRGQAVALKRGVQVVVGTPGRVMDHMRRGTLDVSSVRTLVLDEADEMLRMGFVDDVEWVLSETPAGRQVALFSATMPDAIRSIAERQLNDPQRIRVEGGGKAADTVRQRYWRVEGMTKVEALCRLLAVEPVDAALVFVRTRDAAAGLARNLEDAGYPAAALSGDIAQSQRERTIEALRQGRLKLVVATDVAARGIDVKSISHVFNFDPPEDAEAYIHRIGRTGRAGRTGETILFVENRQKRLLTNIERATGKAIEKMDMPSAEDIHALQLERFGEQLKERLAFKGETPRPAALRAFIEQICLDTGRDALDVAAFLVGPAMKVAQNPSPTQESAKQTPRSSADDTGRPPRLERAERFERAERKPVGRSFSDKRTTYRVEIGSAQGVLPGNLVGAIANEAGIDGKAIGSIKIFDAYSTVDLPADLPQDVLDLLQNTVVRGKPLRIRPYQAGTWTTPTSADKPRPAAPRAPFKTAKTSTHRKGKAKSADAPANTTSAHAKPKVKAKGKLVAKGKPKHKTKHAGAAKPKPKPKTK